MAFWEISLAKYINTLKLYIDFEFFPLWGNLSEGNNPKSEQRLMHQDMIIALFATVKNLKEPRCLSYEK